MAGRVLMIGLDAAEPSLIERWTDDGSLPVLRSRRRGGGYGRLASSAEWLVGSPWATFCTGQSPAEHGLYHSIVWRPHRLDHVRPGPSDLEVRPFWRDLAAQGPRVIAFDVPLTRAPEPFNGIEINGWANTDLLDPMGSYPDNMLGELDRRHGRPPRRLENYRLETVEELLAIRDEQIGVTRMVGQAASGLLAAQSWDLAIVCLHTAHLAGHKLWSDRNVAGEVPAGQREDLADALRQVYIACDSVVGRLVEAAGAGTDVLVFSVHGMGANVCRTDLLAEMLRRVLRRNGAPVRPGRDRLAAGLRGLLPHELRHALKQRMPQRLRDQLTVYWRTGTRDWATTRAFNVFSDLLGYVRVNQKGREAQGIVEPGAERDELLAEVLDGLGSFVDADTGEPVVADSTTVDRLYPAGRRRHLLPDLMLRWSEMDAARHRGLGSPRFGDIPWPTPGRHFTGRSGNHRGQGFLIAGGPGVDGRLSMAEADILDLAPTACRLLGVPSPPSLAGRSLL